MNDEYVLIEAYLLWGYEYSSVLGRWEDARYQLGLAQQLIEIQPESYPEEKVRLLIGLGQIELKDGSLDKAEEFLQAAASLMRHIDGTQIPITSSINRR